MYTVRMLRERQNRRTNTFVRSPPMIVDVCFFYFDPLLIPTTTSQRHDVAAVLQLHIYSAN